MIVTCIIALILALIALFILWKVAKIIVIPLQIAIFILLVFLVYRWLFTAENFNIVREKVESVSGSAPATPRQ